MAYGKKDAAKVDSTPWSVKTNVGAVLATGFKSFSLANTEIRKQTKEFRAKALEVPIMAAIRS